MIDWQHQLLRYLTTYQPPIVSKLPPEVLSLLLFDCTQHVSNLGICMQFLREQLRLLAQSKVVFVHIVQRGRRPRVDGCVIEGSSPYNVDGVGDVFIPSGD